MNNFIEILYKSYLSFQDKLTSSRNKEESNQIKTPKFNDNFIKNEENSGGGKKDKKESKIKFDDETLKKYNILPSTYEKDWEETCILLLQELGKMVKSLLNSNNKL